MHELFAEKAAQLGTATAVECAGRRLAYRELDSRADQLAHALRARGIEPGARVGICMQRSPEIVIAMLATLKAGAAYVPLDPDHPERRLRETLTDAGVALLLTHDPTDHLGGDTLNVSRHPFTDGPTEPPQVHVTPDHVAYLIYTSGSTGRPKGVMVTHRNVVRLFTETGKDFGFGRQDVWSLFHSPAFDFSVWEIWGALLHGGRLVIVPYWVSRSPEALRDLLAEQRVTVLNQTPSAFRQLTAALTPATARRLRTRLVILGGEAVDVPGLAGWFALDRAVPCRLVNMYGITETTVHVTAATIEPDDARPGAPSAIGRPIPDLAVHVLDGDLRPVEPGTTGEMYVAGPGLALGYQGRPGRTAERFLPDPFATEPGARMYRTGDLAAVLPGGDLAYRGRADDQVKIRGFRVEPGEIERCLAELPTVRHATVLAHEDEVRGRFLAAFVIPSTGHDEAAWRAHLRERLPSHMVPSLFLELDELPLTPNGKLDKARLAARIPVTVRSAAQGTAPKGQVEEAVADIWRQVLGVEEVALEDTFTDLGGHSLMATRVVSRLRETLGAELSLRDLLGGGTLKSVCALVEERAKAPEEHQAHEASEGPMPLSPEQERIWYLSRLLPGSPIYNLPFALPWHDDLDLGTMERCLARLVARHETFRTRFVDVAGEPRQRTAEPWLPLIEVEDVDPADRAERERAEARAPFDLAGGRLLRARLLRQEGGPRTLLLTTHHIVFDGWSLEVMLRELEAMYRADLAGLPPHLPDLPIRYADHALQQRERLDSAAIRAQSAYWHARLAGAPPAVELRGDRPRPAAQTFQGGLHRFRWSDRMRRELDELGRRHGATLFMTLMAGFTALLGRYTGQRDLVVGTPVAGRTRGELEPLIGFFVNLLPLRLDLTGDPGFNDLLGRVRDEALAAYEHQELPFERLVGELRPERDPGRTPVVQVMCQLNVRRRPLRLGGRSLPVTQLGTGTSKFDLGLTFEEDGGGITGLLEYNADIFDDATAARLARHLEVLLEAAMAAPGTRLSRLPLMDGAERHRVLHEWNATRTAYPDRACVHELVEEQAAEHPEAIAVEYGDLRLTYRELDTRANRLAHLLRSRGVRPGDRVGTCLRRCPELVAAMLAVLKAGAAYVPLDPEDPAARQRQTLADAGARAVLVHAATRHLLPATEPGPALIDVGDRAARADGGQPSAPPRARCTPDHLAYLIYTSGSTGRPKGVMIRHRSVVRLIRDTDYVSIGPGDGVGQVANAAFDAITFEVWGALANGARVVILPPEVILSPAEFAAAIDRRGVTAMFLTAAAFNVVAQERPDAFRPMRDLLVGGEALDPGWVRTVLRHGAPRRLLNGYGPTETTTFAAWFEVTDVPAGAATVPIGHPISNTEIHVLDAHLEPVPVGFTGEVCIGGPGLATGYLGRPALTAERFVPHPFSRRPGERLYRTGDLGRRRPDGAVEYLGRIDTQIKLRGFRIELGEIEAALADHPSIASAAAAVQERRGDRRLAAFIVPAPGGRPTAAEIRAHLRSRLPDYMVPAVFVTLDALPLSANGKLDRRALGSLQPPDEHAGGQPAAPRTPVEDMLAAIWADILGVERVGPDDDFFELGGHSLLAIRLVSRVNEVLGTALPLRMLMTSATPRALAAEAAKAATAPGPPPLRPGPRRAPLPLSFPQQRLWFMDQIEPGTAVYNVPVILHLPGEPDRAALARALTGVVARHEALRTIFPAPKGMPEQVVAPPGAVQVGWTDLTGSADAAGAAARIAADEGNRPFDLAKGPLVRAHLIKLAPGEHRLLLLLHHIAVDGMSLDVIFDELGVLYGGTGSLPDVPVQAADHAVWQREWLQGDALDGLLDYWRTALGQDPPVLDLPADRPRPARRRFRGAVATRALPPGLVRDLRAVSRREGVTFYMALLAGFQLLLARRAGVTDVTVGTPVSGRTRPELRDVVGCLINMVPVRTDLSGDPGIRELLGRVRRAALGAFAHQELPLDKLVEGLVTRRARDFMPLFRVMFSLLEERRAPVLPGLGECGVELHWPHGIARFDLSLVLQEQGADLGATLEYDSDLFEPGTADKLLAEYERTLEEIASMPGGPD